AGQIKLPQVALQRAKQQLLGKRLQRLVSLGIQRERAGGGALQAAGKAVDVLIQPLVQGRLRKAYGYITQRRFGMKTVDDSERAAAEAKMHGRAPYLGGTGARQVVSYRPFAQ